MKKEEFIQKIAGYVKKYAAAYEIKVCSPILYGLGNNYIYNVNKDKIKGKYMENRNNMNIKERIVYKRLEREGKRIGVIQYYNVLFIMELLSEKDFWALEQLNRCIVNMYMRDIHNWSEGHCIRYSAVFHYRKDYSLRANAYSYLRWRIEKAISTSASSALYC